MSKAAILADLYQKAVQEYTKTPAEWEGLLSCVARFYKRSFDNVVLIYAQKPDATQLGTFDEWHDKRIGRRINRGAKSIAVVDMGNPSASLKYLFDFMDTNGPEQSFKNVMRYYWELGEQYRPSLMARFHETYGMPVSCIEDCFYKLVSDRVGNILPGYMENFRVREESSSFYGMPVDVVKAEFAQFVADSVAYIVFSKCGVSTKSIENCFATISRYNTLEIFMALGSCTVSLARPILKEIQREIENIKSERSQIYENRTFDGHQLQAGGGRVTVSRTANLRERGDGQNAGREIRKTVERVHDGDLPAPSVRVGGERENQRDNTENRWRGNTPQRDVDPAVIEIQADARQRGYVREGGAHEQPDHAGGGNHTERNGDENKIAFAEAEHTAPPIDGYKPSMGVFFAVPPAGWRGQLNDEDISGLVDMVMCAEDITQDIQEWQREICDFFQGGHKQTVKANILKAFYRKLDTDYMTKTGESLHITGAETGIGFETEGQVFSFEYGELAHRIDYLILNGTYPYSSSDSILDGFIIPDEESEMNGAVGEESELEDVKRGTTEQEIIEPLDGDRIIADFLQKGTGVQGGKLQIYRAILSGQTQKDKRTLIKNAYGLYGMSAGSEGRHESMESRPDKGLSIEYRENGQIFSRQLSWTQVEKRITDMIRQNSYLTGEEQEELGTLEELHFTEEGQPGETEASGHSENGQINFLNEHSQFRDTYEDTDGVDNDTLLDGNTAINPPFPFQEGDRISNHGCIYEVLQFLHDGQTVEIADVSLSQNIMEFKIRERVPLSEILYCKLVEYNDTEEENDETEINDDDNTENEIEEEGIDSLTDGQCANYRFSAEHHLYDGGAKTKCKNNIEAVRLLKELQAQERRATTEEQIVLARFVGWGGLASALTPEKSGWESQYKTIKALLSEEEFSSAQHSTITAFYTGQNIISQIYSALEQFGFQGGNILDPAMATGNFYSVLPEGMRNSKLYGVELDTISGEIARKLYPEADIQIKGYEQTNFPDRFFDVVVGNIPFNSFKVSDSRYDKYGFRIHDYFIAKTLDQVHSGGIVAFITAKFTLDKGNSTIRKYIAQRAKLLGAIRLPNSAFTPVSGTNVTADILFLQKRDREIVPDEENTPWLAVEKTEDGVPVNRYFIDHPEMLLGKMVFDESMYSNITTTACHSFPGADLNEQLERAVSCLKGEYREAPPESAGKTDDNKSSRPADPEVRSFSFTMVEDEIYFQEKTCMYLQGITGRKAERIRGMVEITQAVRGLIDYQNRQDDGLPTAEYEAYLKEHIRRLNTIYDRFVKKQGYLNSYGNVIAFSSDSSAPLLRSVEKESKTEKGVFEKSAMFYKATIRPKDMPKAVFSAEDALKVSLNVKGKVDLPYMSWLYQMPDGRKAAPEEIIMELGDAIYQNPDEYTGNASAGWQTAGEYLSGYVKDKLTAAFLKAEEEPERFARNVEALRTVQPEPLTPQDISFTLGTPWIPLDVYQDFMYDTFETMDYYRDGRFAVQLEFSKYSSAYFISSKHAEKTSVTVNQTCGTSRMNAYEILEASLNQRFAEVKDRVDYVDENGEDKVKYVLNKKETIFAREKQAQVKAAFERWLFAEPERGARLTKLYNDKFNNVRPREYDGSGLIFPGISEDVCLRPHQRDAVAHGLFGDGNLLMAHEVGAGKTYAAIALAYEMKRMGKVHKPLFAVPNHLVGQWADAYMSLYPEANILVAEKKDFEKNNRQRFAGRIAAGDYDAIIMAHSSFELIGLSREWQLAAMQLELDGITTAISEQKSHDSKDWSLKQMQIFRSNLQYRYDRLFNANKKDNVVNFEELGVDALIVDEAHAYKNNFSYTKMRNVAGVSGRGSQRAMDMHQKCQYINEIGGGKGVIYLTGTPVSNTMAEMYVLQKTLQPQELRRRDLLMFDSWATTFGKVVSSLEIKPEGSGYQMKNRFAQFHNLPELMSMFSMIADIKTADMLDLPTPTLKAGGVVKTYCTPEQKRIVMELAERAENIRDGKVDSSEDNFLKLTHEARLLSIDPRAIDQTLADDPDTKLNVCAQNVGRIYHETMEGKLAQLIFCDQGTPKYKVNAADDKIGDIMGQGGSFNFYGAVKSALAAQGVKPEEIAFIHDARTDVQREQLFEKVRNGEIRILMGSTGKMGTGMNVQARLIALHHLDVPWRPSDLTQRNGRILRQGNSNGEISIFNYITENTFDAYLWQILEQKQRYISQIMTGRSALRTCEDLDETVLQYAEFKALATSDPRVREKMEVDNEISRLSVLKSEWQSQRNDLQYNITKRYPVEIVKVSRRIEEMAADLATYGQNKPKEFQIDIDGRNYSERTGAAETFMARSGKLARDIGAMLDMGVYAGFTVRLIRSWSGGVSIQLCGKCTYQTDMGESKLGNITRVENLAQRILESEQEEEQKLKSLNQQLAASRAESIKNFPDEERLVEMQTRKVSLDLALEFKQDGGDVMAADDIGKSEFEEEIQYSAAKDCEQEEEQDYER